jgi:hypothetical protein
VVGIQIITFYSTILFFLTCLKCFIKKKEESANKNSLAASYVCHTKKFQEHSVSYGYGPNSLIN